MRRFWAVLALSTLALAACGQATPSSGCEAPSDVPTEGVLLWLQADCGVESTEGNVTEWSSIIGSLQASQALERQQPEFQAEGLAGHPAVWFDGVFDWLEVDLNIHPEAHPEITVVTVFASDTENTDPLRKLYGSDDGHFDRTVGLDDRAANGMNYGFFGGETSAVQGYFALSADTPYLTVDSYGPDAFSGWVNGAEAIADRVVGNREGLPKFYLGGTGTVFNEPWNGPIAEMLVYGRNLTDEERMKVEDYLATKYGLTLSR
jgi:hypothetical protein